MHYFLVLMDSLIMNLRNFMFITCNKITPWRVLSRPFLNFSQTGKRNINLFAKKKRAINSQIAQFKINLELLEFIYHKRKPQHSSFCFFQTFQKHCKVLVEQTSLSRDRNSR